MKFFKFNLSIVSEVTNECIFKKCVEIRVGGKDA